MNTLRDDINAVVVRWRDGRRGTPADLLADICDALARHPAEPDSLAGRLAAIRAETNQ